MGKITQYEHHEWNVFVDEELKGKHREHCLCFKCKRFKPGAGTNCTVAWTVFQTCMKYGLTTPVYECPWYVPGEPDLKGLEPKVTASQEFEEYLNKRGSRKIAKEDK